MSNWPDADAIFGFAMQLAEAGEWQEAFWEIGSIIYRASPDDPKLPLYHRTRAEFLGNLGRYDEAQREIETAAKIENSRIKPLGT